MIEQAQAFAGTRSKSVETRQAIEQKSAKTSALIDVEASTTRAADPPPVKWSAVMIRKRRIENGQQATEAGRDCLEVAAG